MSGSRLPGEVSSEGKRGRELVGEDRLAAMGSGRVGLPRSGSTMEAISSSQRACKLTYGTRAERKLGNRVDNLCRTLSAGLIAAKPTYNHPGCDLVQRLGEPILGLHQILGDLSKRQSLLSIAFPPLTSSVT